MKTITRAVSAVSIIAAVAACLSGSLALAKQTATEPILYVEGIGLDGLEVDEALTGEAPNVMVDWSDNLVFHQYPAGQKVRTEVILHDMEEEVVGPAVFTLQAHFDIYALEEGQQMTECESDPNTTYPGPQGEELYSSSIEQGIWIDGKDDDEYSAEINKEGNLIYGYNWDTRGYDAGWYRLVFWIAQDGTEPPDWADIDEIDYEPVDLTSGALGDHDPLQGTIQGFVCYDFAFDPYDPDPENGTGFDITWLDLYLAPKNKGRK